MYFNAIFWYLVFRSLELDVIKTHHSKQTCFFANYICIRLAFNKISKDKIMSVGRDGLFAFCIKLVYSNNCRIYTQFISFTTFKAGVRNLCQNNQPLKRQIRINIVIFTSKIKRCFCSYSYNLATF